VIVVDTTVLVYAVGTDHPLRASARRIVTAVGDGSLAATTTVEVIQEFAHVRARRRGRADAVAVAGSFATLFGPLLRPDDADVQRGLALYATHDDLGAFDAVLAAAVLGADHLDGLLTADQAFGRVRGLRHYDLADEKTVGQLVG